MRIASPMVNQFKTFLVLVHPANVLKYACFRAARQLGGRWFGGLHTKHRVFPYSKAESSLTLLVKPEVTPDLSGQQRTTKEGRGCAQTTVALGLALLYY